MGITPLYGVVLLACNRYELGGSSFSTANFQKALAEVSGSSPMVTPQVANIILTSLPGVRPDGESHWVFDRSTLPE